MSPYSAETPKIQLNSVNLNRIKAAEAEESPIFKIALISDTHNYYSELDKLISHINNSGPYSFVIIAGDITNLGHLDEFHEARRQFNQLKYPYLVAVGNHDLISNGEKIFKQMFGDGDFAFEYKSINFVFVNSNNWETGGIIPNLDWVDEQLNSFNSPFKVIVSHVPPNDAARFTDKKISEWETLVSNHGVQYILCGHNHNPGVGDLAGTAMITIGSPVKKSYYELIFNGGLTHKKVSF